MKLLSFIVLLFLCSCQKEGDTALLNASAQGSGAGSSPIDSVATDSTTTPVDTTFTHNESYRDSFYNFIVGKSFTLIDVYDSLTEENLYNDTVVTPSWLLDDIYDFSSDYTSIINQGSFISDVFPDNRKWAWDLVVDHGDLYFSFIGLHYNEDAYRISSFTNDRFSGYTTVYPNRRIFVQFRIYPK